MFYPVKLVLKSYVPLSLKVGMLFSTTYLPETEKEFTIIWSLDEIPLASVSSFVEMKGYPIKLSLADEENNKIAENHEIGWLEEDTELRDITIRDLNKILQNCDGLLEIDILEYNWLSQGVLTPRFVNQKVVLRYLQEEYDEENN